MSRVFISEATGAVVYVFTDDHCPPHVHARHRGNDWVARIGFSYLGDAVTLLSIAPLKNIPQLRVLNHLLGEIEARLPDCRKAWWEIRQTTCLTNQWVRVLNGGIVELLPGREVGARQIAKTDYDPGNEVVRLILRDGTTREVRLRS
ncbi:hypothetical protein [Acidiphilium sp. PM]|uniref:hypothetical protein n=1 Tax=Acidiphilium sp. PM TaxID=1043206 RepID=UPI0006806733|nr:hypothetical protein [Acidiphilium sp. PM]